MEGDGGDMYGGGRAGSKREAEREEEGGDGGRSREKKAKTDLESVISKQFQVFGLSPDIRWTDDRLSKVSELLVTDAEQGEERGRREGESGPGSGQHPGPGSGVHHQQDCRT